MPKKEGGLPPSESATNAEATQTVRAQLKMKDLERATGVGREAIRFYIREGLLPEPERPSRNVAWYDESFVERILLIKKLQHERFLPLGVIKGILNGDVMPSDAEVNTLLALDGKLSGGATSSVPPPPEKVSAIAKRLELPVAEIRAVADSNAIEIVTRDGDQWLEGRDVLILQVWAQFRRAGFVDGLGFGPDQLRMYVDICQWLVREELRSFAGAVTGKVDPDTAQAMAERGLVLAGEMLGLMHERMILRAIARGNLPAETTDSPRRDASGDK